LNPKPSISLELNVVLSRAFREIVDAVELALEPHGSPLPAASHITVGWFECLRPHRVPEPLDRFSDRSRIHVRRVARGEDVATDRYNGSVVIHTSHLKTVLSGAEFFVDPPV
jgi:hypothetical protein